VTLTCDKVPVYLDTREAIAEGNVKVTQEGSWMTGERMNYNFDTKMGRVLNASMVSRPFYGRAGDIEKVGENEIDLEKGYASTCDLEEPHYSIHAKQVQVFPGDKVIARHIKFYIGKIPVFYFPYYIQSLKEQTAHATVLLGREKEWGYYALTSFKYGFSDIARGRVRVDYRTKKGLAGGIDNNYSTKELGNGMARFYCINENDLTTAEPVEGQPPRFKYLVQLRHHWDVTDDTVFTMELNKLKDKDFIKDYFYKEFEEQGDPDNYISMVTAKEDYYTTFLLRKRFDRYYTVVERLPEYRIVIPNYRLFEDIPLYFHTNTSGAYLNKTYANDLPTLSDRNSARLDTYNRLSYVTKVLEFLWLTPYAGVRETYYSKDPWSIKSAMRTIFDAGLDASTKFYKIYDYKTNFLGLDINRLRHIITPTAQYYYANPPTISPSNLIQFDEIDALDKHNGVLLALENRLQTKRGPPGEEKSIDLATFIISTDYNFRLRRDWTCKRQKFESVDLQLELLPYPWLYSLSKMSINTKHQNVQTASVDLTAAKGENYLGFGYRYENLTSGSVNLITTEAMYKINNDWKARVYWRYNILQQAFQEQEYTVYRDLHCWILEFTYDIKAEPRDQTFYFIMRLKAFPNVPIGFRNTYSQARPGPADGPRPSQQY
jgi:LPS-assembly protein